MSWAAEEFAAVDFGDKRLNKRLVKVAMQWADKPSQSIPAAAGGWGDTAAAYRMLDNERCDWREVLDAHSQCTVQRMAALAVVLCLTDTTELDFNGQTITGLGPLSFEAQRGMYLHPTYAVSTEREPLGLLDAWMWARKPKDANGQRGDIKESVRWIESYERLAERAVELPQTRLVQVGDRESDILGLMERAQVLGWPVDLLVRSQHNRVLVDNKHLWDEVDAQPVLGEIQFTLGARDGRKPRVVRQQLRAKRMRLDHGKHASGAIEMTCLVASEVDAPPGVKPVCWRPRVGDDNAYAESLFRTAKYRPEFPAKGFADLAAARAWANHFVHWYHQEHRHSGIGYVSPAQRHAGDDAAILAARHALFLKARDLNPARWSGATRDWSPTGPVTLNPKRDSVVSAHLADSDKQRAAA